MMNSDAIFNRIAEALLCDYSSVYYVDAVTNEYLTYSLDPEFRSLKIDFEGKDFFKNLIGDAEKVVYDEDKHIFQKDIQKENLLRDMKNGTMQNIVYRLMIDGKPVYHSLRVIRGISEGDDYFILGVTNIDKEVRIRQEAERLQKERLIYNQITESLASHYSTIYYVDAKTNAYMEFSASSLYDDLGIPKIGPDFYAESAVNIARFVHPADVGHILDTVKKEYILSALAEEPVLRADYRLFLGNNYVYTRMNVMWSNDKTHFIIAVENIDEQVRRENERRRELINANEKAMHDELTGVRNMNAYQSAEADLQSEIESGTCTSFGLMICDLNNLKRINDTHGHKAGDEYIRSACRVICRIFAHSPVFRIGGDEFVVILKGDDYCHRNELLRQLRGEVLENRTKENAPIIASGIADFEPGLHGKVSQVFELADSRMYEDKKQLKAAGIR